MIVRYDSNDSSVKKCVGTYVPAKKGEECGNETVPTCESGLVCKPDGADPKRCYEE
ncbi:MAG: hypothetical protein Q7R81_05350 [Candidatus Peregrinibacteria bacterium]|nr:hypothetical protein [Candidatus Peregrinibacteria bacterium]